MLNRFNKAYTANKIFNPVYFNGASTHIKVALFNGFYQFWNRNVVGAQNIRINIYLVFAYMPSN